MGVYCITVWSTETGNVLATGTVAAGYLASYERNPICKALDWDSDAFYWLQNLYYGGREFRLIEWLDTERRVVVRVEQQEPDTP